jgi:glycine cleavage system P protein (glycine dehydrogenase) subunit 1
MPYIPHTEIETNEMLKDIGVSKIDELWKSIPEEIRLKTKLDLPDPLSEPALIKQMKKLAGQNLDSSSAACFLGGGTYNHFIPPLVDQLISRSEFYTAYTPYQPEISQGTLQAIFEFQTMVCELFGMDVTNASMYDGAQSAAEAVLMAQRIRPKNKDGAVVIADSVNPHYRNVIRTFMRNSDRRILEAGYKDDGGVDISFLEEKARGALAVLVQYPNYFGCVEDLVKISGICEKEKAVFIVVVTEALSMGLLEPPGSFGADIVAGEGQSLGIPMGFGGPHLGLFACGQKNMRKMPGRLCGETVDKKGRRGYVLTLATREQHIRRTKATSNICTNQGLMALAASIYMASMGPSGLAEIAEINRIRAEYLKEKLLLEGAGKIAFSGPTFNEFVLDTGKDPAVIIKEMEKRGFLAGIPLASSYPDLSGSMLITVTEMIDENELDEFAVELKKIISEV